MDSLPRDGFTLFLMLFAPFHTENVQSREVGERGDEGHQGETGQLCEGFRCRVRG